MQFDKVDVSRGAPMGRKTYGQPDGTRNVRLFRVNLYAGYDDGGAYWGCNSTDEYLYCATDGDNYRDFTRARTRLQAVIKLRLPESVMLASPKQQARRYAFKVAGSSQALLNLSILKELGYIE